MTNSITGKLIIPSGTAGFTAPCTVVVREITNSDFPALRPLASSRWDLTYATGDEPAFQVGDIPDDALAAVDEGRKALNLEVHVDVDSSGAFSAGDLVSLSAHPVTRATTTAPVPVPVPLTKI